MGLDMIQKTFLKTILKYIRKNFNSIKWKRFTIIDTSNYVKLYFHSIKTFFIFQKNITPKDYKKIDCGDYTFYFYD